MRMLDSFRKKLPGLTFMVLFHCTLRFLEVQDVLKTGDALIPAGNLFLPKHTLISKHYHKMYSYISLSFVGILEKEGGA